MASPSRSTVKIDKQGRVVLPQHLRDEFFDIPGEAWLERTADGLLLRPVRPAASVRTAEDGLPVLDLDLDEAVRNEEVVAAIRQERDER